jgi:hypothetical protein
MRLPIVNLNLSNHHYGIENFGYFCPVYLDFLSIAIS